MKNEMMQAGSLQVLLKVTADREWEK